MIKKEFEINHTNGLHARPAAALVDIASKFDARVYIAYNEMEVNAKSIISLLSLGLGQGDKFTFVIDGSDEKEALEELTKFIEENTL